MRLGLLWEDLRTRFTGWQIITVGAKFALAKMPTTPEKTSKNTLNRRGKMPELNERCSCGAKFGLNDADVPSLLKAAKDWRKQHFCQVPDPQPESLFAITDASRVELPMGFTAGLNVPVREIEPDEEEE
jgi:hypothetical protein